MCGLVWWVWTIGVLVVWMAAPALAVSEVEGSAPAIPPADLLIYYGIEGLVIALLALGVMRRWRPAAVLLAVGFVVSRLVLILLGLITLGQLSGCHLARHLRGTAVRFRKRRAGNVQLPLVHPTAATGSAVGDSRRDTKEGRVSNPPLPSGIASAGRASCR